MNLLAKDLQQEIEVKVEIFTLPGLHSNPAGAFKTKLKEDALRRIDGISFGTAKLEEAQMGLRDTWKRNLRGAAVVDLMLEKIGRAAKFRFSMINNSLRPSGTVQEEEGGEGQKIKGLVKPEDEDEEFIKPIKRNDSFVKRELTIALISTGRGDAAHLQSCCC